MLIKQVFSGLPNKKKKKKKKKKYLRKYLVTKFFPMGDTMTDTWLGGGKELIRFG